MHQTSLNRSNSQLKLIWIQLFLIEESFNEEEDDEMLTTCDDDKYSKNDSSNYDKSFPWESTPAPAVNKKTVQQLSNSLDTSSPDRENNFELSKNLDISSIVDQKEY